MTKQKQNKEEIKQNPICLSKKKKRQNPVNVEQQHACFCPFMFSLVFFFGEKFFWKTRELHHLFSFLLTQPNTLEKKISSHILSKVFHPSYSTFKQTHPKRGEKSEIHCDTWFSKKKKIFIYFLGVTYTLRILLFTPKDF